MIDILVIVLNALLSIQIFLLVVARGAIQMTAGVPWEKLYIENITLLLILAVFVSLFFPPWVTTLVFAALMGSLIRGVVGDLRRGGEGGTIGG